MFCTKVRGQKAFAPEQKIRELKQRLYKTKTIEKRMKKRIKRISLILKATKNMNNVKSGKYGFALEDIE